MINYKYDENWTQLLTEKSLRPESAIATLHKVTNSTASITEFVTTLIKYALNSLDKDHTLTGIFRLLKYTHKNKISPFLASKNYCIKAISISNTGDIKLNISPIYELGPEYPEYYKESTGKTLNEEAIIGLSRATADPNEPSQFNLGIDAGIAFKDAPISHNKELDLEFKLVDEGVLLNLTCETQSTTKIFSWPELGMPATIITDIYTSENSNNWAA